MVSKMLDDVAPIYWIGLYVIVIMKTAKLFNNQTSSSPESLFG